MLSYLMNEMSFGKKRDYECTALTNWATGPKLKDNYIIFFKLSINEKFSFEVFKLYSLFFKFKSF